VSRWSSPEKAARRAERAAKDAAQRRKEKRHSLMLVVGVAVVSFGLVVADYLWLRHQATQKHEQRYHRGARINAPASAAPVAGQNQATNHE
jgi:heme/copper-type cytochrome/quinol oxidase subunit 3